eukprot:1136837-Pelagomonas_calceolata.AAC.1
MAVSICLPSNRVFGAGSWEQQGSGLAQSELSLCEQNGDAPASPPPKSTESSCRDIGNYRTSYLHQIFPDRTCSLLIGMKRIGGGHAMHGEKIFIFQLIVMKQG